MRKNRRRQMWAVRHVQPRRQRVIAMTVKSKPFRFHIVTPFVATKLATTGKGRNAPRGLVTHQSPIMWVFRQILKTVLGN